MNSGKKRVTVIRIIDAILKHIILVVLMLLLIYALYIQYDNYMLVANADSRQYSEYRPATDNSLSFEQLRALNPDVIGWITIDDTNVDYPIVQGEDNDTYVNTDVFGEFSLTGAIFLDSRNASDFSDTVSILYGHDMEGDMMFGGIDQYRDRAYFNGHLTGTLFHDGEYYKLDIFALLETNGYNASLYDLTITQDSYAEWMSSARGLMIHHTDDIPDDGPILLMSTCQAGVTDGRVVLAAKISPGGHPPVIEQHKSVFQFHLPDPSGIRWWQILLAGVILLFITIGYERRRKKANKNIE